MCKVMVQQVELVSSHFYAAGFIHMTYLTGKIRKGAALVREGGVINNMPMKHIELTVGHCILTRKIHVNTIEWKHKAEVQIISSYYYQSFQNGRHW